MNNIFYKCTGGVATILTLIFFLIPQLVYATFTKQQATNNCSTSGTTVTCTVSPTGAGNFGILVEDLGNTNNSTPSGGGTWTLACHVTVTGSDSLYVYYNNSLTGGVTSITYPITSGVGRAGFYYEFSSDNPITYDTCGTINNPSESSTQAGVALTLAGSNEGIVQFAKTNSTGLTGINGGYITTVAGTQFRNGAYLINTTNGAAPNWTISGTGVGAGVALSFYDSSSQGSLPTISSFSANPNSITLGNSSTLSWTVSGATSLSIDNNVGNQNSLTNGSVSVTPSQTTVYTLTATNATGSVTSPVTVTVGTANGPVISNITSSNITQNSVTVTWTTDVNSDSQVDYGLTNSYGSSSALDPTLTKSHSVTLNGLSPSTSYHYEVISKDSSGIQSLPNDQTFTTAGNGNTPPVITSFTANPASITSGQSSTLSWTATGNPAPTFSINNGVGNVNGNQTSVTPTQTTAYTLTAANSQGTTTANTTVTVTGVGGLPINLTQNSGSVGRYDIYELTMTNPTSYANSWNAWEDPTITAVFTAPSGKQFTVGGFYYMGKSDGLQADSGTLNTWKLRFAANELGNWTWTLSYADGLGGTFNSSGNFTSVASNNSGFLRQDPANPYRFITEGTGKIFYGMGIVGNYPNSNAPGSSLFNIQTPFFQWDLGDFGSSAQVGFDDYFNVFANSGANLFWDLAPGNSMHTFSSLNVNGSGKNTYDVTDGKMRDELAQMLHKYGYKYDLDFWSNASQALGGSNFPNWTATGMQQATLNIHRYMINRYGAYVGQWALLDEQTPPQSYIDTVVSYIQNNDPYGHPISTSYATANAGLTVETGNFFDNTNTLGLDNSVANGSSAGFNTQHAAHPNHAVIETEGSSGPYGAEDPERTRIIIWTGFFTEGNVTFWAQASDAAVDLGSSALENTVLGVQDKKYIKVLSNFASDFDPAAKPLGATESAQVRGYLLGSSQDVGGYFIHTTSHDITLSGATVTLNIPAGVTQGQWIDPSTGTLVQAFTTNSGQQTLNIPAFTGDIALRIRTPQATPVLQFDLPVYSVQSGSGNVTVNVTRTAGSGATSVSYATADSLGKAGVDYSPTSGTLSWNNGDMSPKTFSVPLLSNPSANINEDIRLNLSNPTNGAILGNNATAVISIVNPNPNGVQFSAVDYAVMKNAGTLPVSIQRVGSGAGTQTVMFWTRPSSGGTGIATAGVDFTAIPITTLTWNNGDMAPKTVNIPIINSATVGNVTFVMEIKEPRGGEVIGATRPIVTIVDNRSPSPGTLRPTGYNKIIKSGYEATAYQYVFNENAGNAKVTVSRSNGTSGVVSINYATVAVPGTAVPGTDYTAANGTLTWANGDGADKVITIPIFHNASTIANRLFYILLSSPSDPSIMPPTRDVQVVLQDVDNQNNNSIPTITSFTANPASINSGQSSTLSWTATGNPAPTFSINNGVGNVNGNQTSVTPTQTTAYTLTATNSQGAATANATVTVGSINNNSTNTITVTEQSGSNQTNYPVQIGRPFVQGEIASGQSPQAFINGSSLPTQVDVKERWPDGSLKFAVISFLVPTLNANQTITVSFAPGATVGNTALTQPQMLAGGYNFGAQMQLTNGQTITADARTMLTNGDYTTWTSGPIATTILLADDKNQQTCNGKACSKYDIGFDAYHSIRPRFYATFWAGINKVQVRYVGEITNTETLQDQTYSLILTAGNTSPAQVYTQPTFTQSGATRWTRVFWIGTAPTSIALNNNLAYLESTTLLPNYDTSFSMPAAAITNQCNFWKGDQNSIGSAGTWDKNMPDAGSREDIGIYEDWVVDYLYTGNSCLHDMAFGNANLQGSWPVYLREGKAGKIILRTDTPNSGTGVGHIVSVSGRPTMDGLSNFGTNGPDAITPVGSMTTQNWNYDPGHEPEPGSPLYLVSGDYYYLEEQWFRAGYDEADTIGPNSLYAERGPTGVEGVLGHSQLRAMAWELRNRVNTASLSPDGTPEQTYFTALTNDAIAMEEGARNITTTGFNGTTSWKWGRSYATNPNVAFEFGGSSKIPEGTPTPLHQFTGGSGAFAQGGYGICGAADGLPYPCNPLTVNQANSLFESDYMLYSLGHAKELGFPAGALLSWGGSLYTGMLTDPNFNPYIVQNGRVPTVKADDAYFASFADLLTGYTAAWQKTGSFANDPDGYSAYVTAAVSYLTGEPNGQAAWSFLQQHYLANNTNAQSDPKWNIIPRAGSGGGGGGGDTTPPSNPTNLAATVVSSSAINLAWTASTDNVGVTGYKIFRGGSQVNTSATNSYPDTGLNPNTSYSYYVTAYDAAGNNSGQSNIASATTQNATLPVISNIVSSGITQNTATVSWNTSTLTNGQVNYGLSPAYGLQSALVNNNPMTLLHTINLAALSPSTLYHYQVVSTDASNPPNTVKSGDNTFLTQSGVDNTPPAAINNLSSSAITQSSALLSWTAPGNDGNIGTAASYDIRYNTVLITNNNWNTSTQAFGEPNPLIAGTPQTYTLVGLTPATTYFVAIKTSDAAGNISGLSNVPTFTTQTQGQNPDTTPPTVSITLPHPNDILSGISTPITATAVDPIVNGAFTSGVKNVQFKIDGSNLATILTPPYSTVWDTTKVGNGSHTVSALATDNAGNISIPASVSVSVNNTNNNPPPPTLILSLTTNPTSGTAPVNGVSLIAGVTGTATGPMNYYFYCNRSDSLTATSTVASPDKLISADNNPNETASSLCNYPNPGTYTAKVIVERNGQVSESRANVIVSPGSGGGGGGGSGGGGGGGGASGGTGGGTPTITNFQASALDSQISLSWTDPSDPSFVRAFLVRQQGSNPPSSPTDGVKIYEGLSTSFIDTGLTNSQVYSYAIFPVLLTGISNTASASLQASPQAGVISTTQQSNTTTHTTTQASPTQHILTLLTLNQTGDLVLLLQKVLVSEGLFPGTKQTGYFGPLTEAAVQAFQRKYNIVSSGTPSTTGYGNVGPGTRAKINQLLDQLSGVSTISSQTTSTISSHTTGITITTLLHTGTANAQVTLLQQFLAQYPSLYPEGLITGYYGPATQRAVERYQVKYGIAGPGDQGYGQVGPKTRARLGE